MINQAQDWKHHFPLIQPQGNVGSIEQPQSFAAERYVELKLSNFTLDTIIKDLSKHSVNYVDNYDNTTKEPETLPTLIPMILINGVTGIASGYASSIPPHNLNEVVEATINYIQNKEITNDEIIKFIKGPDLPVGGTIINKEDISKIYSKGEGIFRIKCNIEIGKYKNKECVVIKEIPFASSIDNIVESIKENTIPDKKDKTPKVFTDKIHEIVNDSEGNNICIYIIPKNDVDLNLLINLLHQNTDLTYSLSYQPNVLYKDQFIANCSILDMISKWYTYRVTTIKRKYQYSIKNYQERIYYYKALMLAQNNIDQVLKIIRSSSDKENVKEQLVKTLNIAYKEANYIAETPLYKLAKLEVSKLQEDIDNIKLKIEDSIVILSDINKIDAIIIDELNDIGKKYKHERVTNIEQLEELSNTDVIESEDFLVALTSDNLLYSEIISDLKTYKKKGAKGSSFISNKKKIVKKMFTLNTKDKVLVFTSKGKVFTLDAYLFKVNGLSIVNLINIDTSDSVVTIEKLSNSGFYVVINKDSTIKRLKAEDLNFMRKMSNGNIVRKDVEGLELADVVHIPFCEEFNKLIDANLYVNLITNQGYGMKIKVSNIPEMTLQAVGRRTTNFKNESDFIKSINLVYDESHLLIVLASGYGKLIKVSDILEKKSESGSNTPFVLTKLKNNKDYVVGTNVINDIESSEAIITTAKGKTNKFSIKECSINGRAASGSRLISINDDDVIVSVNVSD